MWPSSRSQARWISAGPAVRAAPLPGAEAGFPASPTLVGVLSAAPPGCPVGSDSTFVDLGAPEILLFVTGDQQPPTAPREGSSTFVRISRHDPLEVGSTLTCSTGNWAGQSTFSYAFADAATGKVLQNGAAATFVPGPAAAHTRIACTAFASNAGGTASLTTNPTGPIAASARPAGSGASPAPTQGNQPPPSTGTISARAYKAKTIAEKARAIPSPPVERGSSTAVPKWNGYLRLALIENRAYGGSRYRATYVRCWSSTSWGSASSSRSSSFDAGKTRLGFYTRGSSWIDVPLPTCASAARAARGRLTTATVVALGTILRETFTRQGDAAGSNATCQGAIGIWQAVDREKGPAAARRAWGLLLGWYSKHLDGSSLHAFHACISGFDPGAGA